MIGDKIDTFTSEVGEYLDDLNDETADLIDQQRTLYEQALRVSVVAITDKVLTEWVQSVNQPENEEQREAIVKHINALLVQELGEWYARISSVPETEDEPPSQEGEEVDTQ